MTHITHNINRHRQRHGMATFIVVLLLSITLVVAYTVMRTQSVAVKIQQNATQQISARQAAASGIAIALKKMHIAAGEDKWDGVDIPITGRLGQYERYRVTYTTGDLSIIKPSDPDYHDLPYRVTLLSTGYAKDPNTQTELTYQIRAVVRLAPRELAPEPTNWETMQQYTIYQQSSTAPIPTPANYQPWHKLGIAYSGWPPNLPNSFLPQKQYLDDLDQMRLNVQSSTSPKVFFVFQNFFAPDFTQNSSSIHASNWQHEITHPGEITSYKFYHGGKKYYTQPLFQTPDLETNPLGLFYHTRDVDLKDDVTVHGTIIISGSGKLRVKGKNVHLKPIDLHPIKDPSSPHNDLPVRLPAIIAASDIEIHHGAQGIIDGIVVNWGEFTVKETDKDHPIINITINGRIFTESLSIDKQDNQKERTLENAPMIDWGTWYGKFIKQLPDDDAKPHFPIWLKTYNDQKQTREIVVKPNSASVCYHWKNLDPIYVPHPDDAGLRWDLLEWTENPKNLN